MNPPATSTFAAEPARGPARWFHPVWLTLAAVGLALVAHFATLWRLPLPQCLLRTYAGIPCPTCGCTRSLLAWARFDLAAAFRFNPLFFLVCAALLAWLLVWTAEKISRRPLPGNLRARAARWPVWRILLGLAALNWAWLCFALPR